MKTLIVLLRTVLGKTITVLAYIAMFALYYFNLKSPDTEAWMLHDGYLHGTFAAVFLIGLIFGAVSGFLFGRVFPKQSYQQNNIWDNAKAMSADELQTLPDGNFKQAVEAMRK